MTRVIAVAAFLVASACNGPALAQGAAPPPAVDDGQRCRALIEPFTAEIGQVTPVGKTVCEFADLRVGLSSAVTYSVDRLVLGGFPAELAAGQTPPTLHAEAHGVRVTANAAAPTARYIVRLLSRPFDVAVDYARANDGVMTAAASYTHPVFGTASVNATLENVPTPEALTSDGPGQVRLRTLRLHIDGRGFFEAMIAPALVGYLFNAGGDTDPDRAVASAKAQAAELAKSVLDGAGSPASLRAALDYVAALPHPDRPFDLWVAPPHPISPEDAADPTRLHAAMPAGSFSASYPAP